MRFQKPPLRIQISNFTAKTYSHQTLSIPSRLDYAEYGRLIQRCTDHRLLRQGKQLHSRLLVFSVTLDNFLASKLITFYSKSGLLHCAHKVFDEIPHKNTFSWNALLMGYSFHNRYSDVLGLFRSFVCSSSAYAKPDNFTITCVLKALFLLFPYSSLAKMIHSVAIQHGFDSDVFVVNALITYYFKCDDIVSARNLFDWTPVRDLVSWNSMIAGYSQGGYTEACKSLYREMLNVENVRPNAVTVVSILQACSQSNDLVLGKEVHHLVTDNNIEIDLSVYNSFISLYAKCGSLDYARELFEEASEKDEITYGALISGYMSHGFVDEAMDIFSEMKRPGLSTWNAVISGRIQNNMYDGTVDFVHQMQALGFRPNTVTLSSILPAISYFSNLKGGKEIHSYAIKHNHSTNIYVATGIIDTYAKLGFLRGAQTVFDQTKDRSVIVWTAVISAYAAHGDVQSAIDLFDEMLNQRTQPDPVTFTAILTACAHSGHVNRAWSIFNEMLPRYKIIPLAEHYACMVGVLSRAGKLDEAKELVNTMPIEPSAKVWGALLNGAWVFGNLELGEVVFNRLFEIEPENTGNYIIMANLYSRAGKWKEAENVRRKMNNVGLTKIPGSSWIETRYGLQCFKARDLSNERSEEIYAVLELLIMSMREEGYVLKDDFDEEGICESAEN